MISALREIEARAWLYVGRGKAEHVRAAAMTVLALDLNRVGAARLAVESRGEPLDRADRLVIVKSLPPGSMVTYEHLLPHEEPMLWMADAVAWCYGAGSRWRPRVDPLITRVVTVEPHPSAGRR